MSDHLASSPESAASVEAAAPTTEWILDESKREIFLLTACREDREGASTHGRNSILRMDSGGSAEESRSFTSSPPPPASPFGSRPASINSSGRTQSYSAMTGPRRSGMCMTWVTPACLEQNRIVMVLSKHNATTNILLRGQHHHHQGQGAPPQTPPTGSGRQGHFVLHLLSVDQVELVKTFGLQSSRDRDKFEGIDHSLVFFDDAASSSEEQPLDTSTGSVSCHGIPLLPDTCGWAKGTVISVMDSGDRYVVLAHVENQHYDSSKTPLRVQDLKNLDEETVELLDRKFRRDIRRDRRMRSQQQVHWMAQAEKGCEQSVSLLGSVKSHKVGVRKGRKSEARTVFSGEQRQDSSLSSATAASTASSSPPVFGDA